MTLVSKNACIGKLGDIVKKYNNAHHNTNKMKPLDINSNRFIDFGAENNDTDSKFGVGDHVRISKDKNILTKIYAANWSEDVFVIKKV